MAARGGSAVSKKAKKKREKGRPANYGGATPEQVAKAVLSQRRKPSQPEPKPAVNPKI